MVGDLRRHGWIMPAYTMPLEGGEVDMRVLYSTLLDCNVQYVLWVCSPCINELAMSWQRIDHACPHDAPGRRRGGRDSTVRYSIGLYSVVLYCTVLYCTVQYCNALYSSAVLRYDVSKYFSVLAVWTSA